MLWAVHPSGLRLVCLVGAGCSYDNEVPRHRAFVASFEFAARLVNNGEYLRFIEDRGYDRPELWLSDGWAARQRAGWSAPLHWQRDGSAFELFTLRGMRPLDPAEPVCHVSYYEADAFARWAGARLPTEFEWETAVGPKEVSGNFLDSGSLHPAPSGISYYGDAWAWTASPYVAYPG